MNRHAFTLLVMVSCVLAALALNDTIAGNRAPREGTTLDLPATIYVSPMGSDAGDGSSASPFQTIQKGIDVALDGDTVRVFAGTYTGAINVNKSIVLVGSGPDTATTIEAPGDFGTSVAYDYPLTNFFTERAIVHIGAESALDVVMRGFVVDGRRLGPDISQYVGYSGILAEQCHVVITDNIIRNILPADSSSSTWDPAKVSNGRGIHVRGEGAVAAISNNTLEQINRFHILIDASDFNDALPTVFPTAIVSNNTIVGKGIYNGGQKGIWFDLGAWGTASGNTLSDFDSPDPTIEPERASGIVAYRCSADPAHRRIFVNNTLTASSFTNNKGIYDWGTGDSIADNTITGFRWGIEIHDGNFVHVARNAVLGGQVGVLVGTESTPPTAETVIIGGGQPADKNIIKGQLPAASGGNAIALSFRDTLGYNIFLNTIPVDARNNDFGVYTDAEVRARIWDCADTTLIFGIPVDTVLYSPFYNPPLPIQLASFTATALNSGYVRSAWTTLTEINNYGFYVQRKRVNEPGFTTVPNSFVPGHGTTNQPHNYTFVDSTATIDRWNYRLEQIDLDGSIHYTEAITVTVLAGVGESIPHVFALQQNYPNPFNPSTTISYQLPAPTHVTLRVFDMLGREVATLVNGVQDAGDKAVLWDATRMSSGEYFYRLDAGSFTSVKRLLLLK